MKKLHGIAINIKEPILGKITYSSVNIFNRKDYIFVCNGHITNFGYAAQITANKEQSQKITSPFIYNVQNISLLNNDDVVAINQNGEISVLFEKQSVHNSILITERCNCNCIMCPQPKVIHEDSKLSQNLKLLSLIDKEIVSLGITGGEPTLIGDKLFDILKFTKKRFPKIALTLLTNGIKFEDFDYAKKIAAIKLYDLQIDIPIYSDTDQTHNKIVGANGFYRTIKGLYNLALFNQRIGIRIVIHKQNYKRLPQLAEFIYHNFPFVCHIAFMQMETTGLAEKNISDLWIDPYDYNIELEQSILYLYQRDMNVSIYNSQLCILPKNLRKFSRKSISDWKTLYIAKCNECDLKCDCAGFFSTGIHKFSEHINPLKTNI